MMLHCTYVCIPISGMAFIAPFQNCNIRYIEETTKAIVSVKPQWSGIKDGLLFSIKHVSYDDVRYAEDLLYKLLDKVSTRIYQDFR